MKRVHLEQVYKTKGKKTAAFSTLTSMLTLQLRGLAHGQQHLGAERGRAALPPTELGQAASNGKWSPPLRARGDLEIKSVWAPRPQGKAPGRC